MKRIAIISAYAYVEHHANYGSLLQYFALQTCLESLGLQPFWVRYVLPEEHSITYEIKEVVKVCTSSYDRDRIKAINGQNRFIKNYLRLSEKEYCGFDEIANNPPVADLYITGSDQVWGGCIEANYLRFAPEGKTKIAYAASFGQSKLTEEQCSLIPDWIREIKYVSLRESEGVRICDELGIPSIMVADPTLLLNENDYPICEPITRPDLFCYFLNKFTLDKHVDSLIQSSNTVFCGGVNKNATSYRSFERILSPEEWIGMIKGAGTILTNSFHGMIFSIIYKKPFVVFLQNGETGAQNSRIFSFLSYIGLQDRIYQSPEQFDKLLEAEIDWEKVNWHIDSLRSISIDFIKNALKPV